MHLVTSTMGPPGYAPHPAFHLRYLKVLFSEERYRAALNFKMDLYKVEVPTSINGLRCKLLKIYYAKHKGFENSFIF